MGRPKGSKNKATLAKEARSKAAKKAAANRRGPRKTFARPLSKTARAVRTPRAKRESTDVTALLTSHLDAHKEHLKPVLESQVQSSSAMQMCLSSLKILIEVHRAAFLDSWKQYIEHMARADQEASPETYLKLFGHQAAVLGFAVPDLMPYLDTQPTVRINGEVTEKIDVPQTEQPAQNVNGQANLDML